MSVVESKQLGPSHSKPLRLAGAALYWALSRDLRKAGRYVKRLSDEVGGEGIMLALCAWADAFADHATDGDPNGRPKAMTMINAATGQAETIEESEAPADVKWAARWVHARASQDHDLCDQLLDELPRDDAKAVGDHVIAVLDCVAETMNGLPRGYARMGQRRP